MKGKFLLLLSLPCIVLTILNPFFFHASKIELISLIMWFYQYSMIGILLFPTVATIFPKLPDKGYSLSKLFSIILLFYINWIFTSLGLMEFSAPSLSFSLLLLMILSHIIPHKDEDLFALIYEKKKFIFKAEFLYLLVFSSFLVIQSQHPDIYWGEKPMDYTLLNFNIRNTSLPLQDPWFAGNEMHYYYLGYYFYAGMAKMTGVGGELGYALSLVTSAALFAISLFGLLVYLTKRAWTSFWGVLLILYAGNLKSFVSIVIDKKKIDFYSFWSSARVFRGDGFAEFPSWSFLFADLHPHVMSYAYSMLYLLVMIYCVEHLWNKKLSSSTLSGVITLSLCFGVLLGINGWDFIIYALFSCCYFLLSWKRLHFDLKAAFLHFVSHALSLLFFLPMLLTLQSGKEMKWGYYQGALNTWKSHFLFHGHWWLIILFMVAPVLFLHRKGVRWNVLFRSIGFRFALTSFILAFIAEFFFFSDRINTIFKSFTNIYIWGGIATVISFRFFKFYITRKNLVGFALSSIFIVNLVLVGSYFNFKGIINKHYFSKVSKGLRGGAYLNQYDENEYKMIGWINENIRGTPTVVERYSKSFDTRAARVSMHTGLPTYLGWDGHVYLRGAPWHKIQQRKRDIDFIFSGSDPIATVDFLDRKNIHFIVVGGLERRYYSKVGLDKFSDNSEMFKLLFKSGNSALYGVGQYKNFLIE